MDTILALATAPGRAGLAVVRLSGPSAMPMAAALAGDLPERGRSLRRLRDAEGRILDEALVLTFPAGASFTGESVVELHLHGSPAVVQAVQAALLADGRGRLAEPGEFTRRALENGRLDLAQVEGLADLLAAETEAQRRQAMRVMTGELGRVADGWRVGLIRARALIEATIDFADEDVPVDVAPEVRALLEPIRAEMMRLAGGTRMAERIRAGFEVAIVGAPNAGKSTLLNRLAGREAAITSAHAGTTRDVIEVRMDLNGLPVTLLDTAGIRETDEPVERIGIARARDRAAEADLRVHLVVAGMGPVMEVAPGDIVVPAKDDEGREDGVSGLTGVGIDRLVNEIAARLGVLSAGAGLATRERHRAAMLGAVAHLDQAMALLPESVERADEIAEELRLATRGVDSIVGRVDVEDILDVVFASFCIGK